MKNPGKLNIEHFLWKWGESSSPKVQITEESPPTTVAKKSKKHWFGILGIKE